MLTYTKNKKIKIKETSKKTYFAFKNNKRIRTDKLGALIWQSCNNSPTCCARRSWDLDPDKIFDIWLAAFRQLYKAGGYMDITLHPFVSGRALRIDMLDRLLFEMKKMPGVWFPTCAELSDYCYANFPPKS